MAMIAAVKYQLSSNLLDGKCLQERDVAINNGLAHKALFNPSDLSEMVSASRQVEVSLGIGVKTQVSAFFHN